MRERRRVLVTGADGVIGEIVRRQLSERYELSHLTRRPAAFPSHVADLSNLGSIRLAFEGIDAVVHLAASSAVNARWEDVLPNNIVGTYNVFEAARRSGVRRVVFASSNHAVGTYEIEGAPDIYDLDDPRVYDASSPARPDSLYGVSKLFGEAIGRLYADVHGMEVVCLRIGAVRGTEEALAPDGSRGQPVPVPAAGESRDRLRATWLSHRDCAQLIARALDAKIKWAIVYGVSNNPRRFWDLDGARDLLGYEPEDSAPR